jgi:hypothetical protein
MGGAVSVDNDHLGPSLDRGCRHALQYVGVTTGISGFYLNV